jgi:hypothetical protein
MLSKHTTPLKNVNIVLAALTGHYGAWREPYEIDDNMDLIHVG